MTQQGFHICPRWKAVWTSRRPTRGVPLRTTLVATALSILCTSAFASERDRLELAGASPCAVCHIASTSPEVAMEEVKAGQWLDSVHAARGVGCEKCHGGDPASTDPVQAHRGVLAPANFRSPINPANLSDTCGACHRREAFAFGKSLHQSLVVAGDRRAPTCVTCHGSMGDRVPTPAALEARCAACHVRGSAREDYPALMRRAVETLNQLRERADAFGPIVAAIGDRENRAERTGMIYDAKDDLSEAMAALHRLDAPALRQRLEAARQRLDATAGVWGTRTPAR